MGGAIIRDQIQFLVRIGGQQSAQETDEGGTVVAPDRFGPYLSAMDLQGGQQRGGSVPLVFVAKPFNAAVLEANEVGFDPRLEWRFSHPPIAPPHCGADASRVRQWPASWVQILDPGSLSSSGTDAVVRIRPTEPTARCRPPPPDAEPEFEHSSGSRPAPEGCCRPWQQCGGEPRHHISACALDLAGPPSQPNDRRQTAAAI